jgi:hypothetical protein
MDRSSLLGRTVGIPNKYLDKLDASQRKFIISTGYGLRFYDEFLTQHGKHLFIFGTTGSGKTNKGYAFVDWLKYLETQIWFDSCKTKEILPLLCMNRKVRIITPTGTDISIEEYRDRKWQKIPDHPEIIHVSSPYDALSSIATGYFSINGIKTTDHSRRFRDTITIISFRNAFSKKELAVAWVSEFFELLAERLRESTLPDITPASVHVDESQWAMAGKRISGEGIRSKASEVITENALDLRSNQIRLVIYAQDHMNIPPAARENMLFNVLCRGADVTSEENGNLSKWCRFVPERDPPSPMQFQPYHGRFVFENGDSQPPRNPWHFRLYPLEEADRKWIRGLRIRYTGKHDTRAEIYETTEECLPELGRFSAMAIKPGKQEKIISRWESEGVKIDE